jgi:hypothetical protein
MLLAAVQQPMGIQPPEVTASLKHLEFLRFRVTEVCRRQHSHPLGVVML